MPNNLLDMKTPTGFSGGIALGGGDTGAVQLAQPGYYGVLLTADKPSQAIVFPAGTALLRYLIMPGETVAGAGTVDVGPTGGTADAYLADGPLTAPKEAALAAAVMFTSETSVTFTATGLTGDAFVALQAINPRIDR